MTGFAANRFQLLRGGLRTGFAMLAAAALITVLAAAKARADCDVPDDGTGIREDVAFRADVGGTRAALANAGIGIGGVYYAEAFQNWGGMHDGSAYDGVLQLYINADMKKLGLWKGLCFFANGYQIHGKSITAEYVGALMPISSLEASPATRLFEMWFQQSLFNDKVTVKVGQLAADAEFILSEGGGYFLNGTWGWPSITAADLPNGGPAYPLATPGVRVAINPSERYGVMVALYNGDPASPCRRSENPQVCNDHGVDFLMEGPPLLMAEGMYNYSPDGLRGIIKVGGWNHFGDFDHMRFDVAGGPFEVSGNPARILNDNWGLYGIIDQLIWRVPGSEDPHGVGIFARFIGAPDDRNLVDFYFDGGFTFSGMIPGRPDDAIAIGFAYTGISDQVSAFDLDTGAPVARNHKSLIEVTYTYQINAGWNVQPTFQYVFQPGGNVAGVDDAAVVGARSSLNF